MKKRLLLITLISIFSLPLYAAETLDHIVAVVNDTPITQTELNDSLETAKKQMAAAGATLPPDSLLRKQVLQHIIDKKLQLQIIEQTGLKIDDAQLDKAINHIAEENKLSTSELYTQLTQQGMTVEDYRKEIREAMLIQQLEQQQVGSKITVTPQEVSDFMHSKPWQAANNKEYHLEDILIALPDSPTTQQIQEARAHANSVIDKIHHNTNFHDAAISESSDNDLGWRKMSEIPSAFSEKLMQMKNNDIAGPIQTSNGFHIIHLAGLRESESDHAATTKQIEMQLYQRKMDEAVQTWMAKMRSQAYINMNPEA